MKKYIIIILSLLAINNVCNGQEWIQYQPQLPVVEVPSIPAHTFSTSAVVHKPLIYRWVPYIINEPVIVERSGIFCHKTIIVYRPTIYWVYQLSYTY